MFPRHKRVQRSEFKTAIKNGRRLSSPNFNIIIPQETSGYAVVISKKTSKLSVTRHKIKRRVLSALRSLQSLPPTVIIYPRASVLDMEYDDIRRELTKLLT